MWSELCEMLPDIVKDYPEYNIAQYKKAINYWNGNNMIGCKNLELVEFFQNKLQEEMRKYGDTI